MNDEIKEIRDILFELQFLGNEETQSKVVKLHNYITNLQQENERLKDIVVEKDSQIKEMILKKTDYTAVNILEMKLEDYKTRCEKAIEYIDKQNSQMTDLNIYGIEDVLCFKGNADKLLNILQNGSEEK